MGEWHPGTLSPKAEVDTMRRLFPFRVAYVLTFAASAVAAGAYSIPADKLDVQKVYWGSAESFEKAAKVNYEAVVRATPEYEEIKKKKIESGTAKYWIQLSMASDRAVRVISQVGQETDYDLIAASGYLGSLEPPIPADDITDMILKKIEEQ